MTLYVGVVMVSKDVWNGKKDVATVVTLSNERTEGDALKYLIEAAQQKHPGYGLHKPFVEEVGKELIVAAYKAMET